MPPVLSADSVPILYYVQFVWLQLTTFLTLDSDKTVNNTKTTSVVIASVVPQIEVTLVTSTKGWGKESSGGDVESSSMVPDSSSLDTHSMYWATIATTAHNNTEVHYSFNEFFPSQNVNFLSLYTVCIIQGGPKIGSIGFPQNSFFFSFLRKY